MKNFFLLLLITCSTALYAQKIIPPAFTPATERIASMQKRSDLLDKSLVKNLEFRSVGPTVFSGRVADIEVSPDDPSHFYVGYASGGLWKTESNGTRFSPLFDHELVMTIGDIAVDWKNNVLWVGTGEVNSSRSSYSGIGMFRSDDGGKTWEHRGLGESHHIGRVILHPSDPNTLWVAVLGHLYSPNQERGVYKTTDGGKTWKRTLFSNQNAGAIDLVIDPSNPDILYAATWERERRAWNFVESGAGSGIWKSTDGGATWDKLTETTKSGFPVGEGVGRIGLDLVQQNGKTILYAVLDNYNRRPKEEKETKEEELTKDVLRLMTNDAFLNLDAALVEKYLKDNNFPKIYTKDKVRQMIENQDIKPSALVEYVEDANSLLFDTPVVGAEVYRSDDQGKTWQKTHEGYLDDIYYSYGYYFGQIRVAKDNPEQVYIMGVPVLSSTDGGKTFESINGANVHADHHALWVSEERPGHLILGNDGGINISYDNGESWFKCNNPPLGQFYDINHDYAEPYNVYGGLQDNGTWKGPSTYEASDRWHGTGKYPYEFLTGGDGMQVMIDKRDNATVYTGFQFGNYFRSNLNTGDRKYITPKHELGERPLRWNWQTPILLSVHNQDIFYMGSNKLHRSFDRGDNFGVISPDLTTGGIKGDVAFSTLTSISESPFKFGLLYVGSDDGLVHVTQDGGNQWTKISNSLPTNMWVSRVVASQHDTATVYVTLNGYRWDNFNAMVFKSTNYGQSWERIGRDLPLEPVNVIEEDPVNPQVLYVGTDHAVYVSLDHGGTFQKFGNSLPAVAVHDLEVHPSHNDLIVGTHGRSIYIGNVSEVQQLNEDILASTLKVFPMDKVKYRGNWGNSFSQWRTAKEPKQDLVVYSRQPANVQITVRPKDSNIILAITKNVLETGLNYLDYDLHVDENRVKEYQTFLSQKNTDKKANPVKLEPAKNGKVYLQKGTYEVFVKTGKIEEKVELLIE